MNRYDDSLRIERYAESFDKLEERFSYIENEFHMLKEERNQQESAKNRIRENHLFEKLIKDNEILKNNNENLSDDLLEWKNAFKDKSNECEINREKYLKAQQLSEELRHELEIYKSQNSEEQINPTLKLSNERMKEQIEELAHLPYLLENKQLELKESNLKLKLAEKTITALSEDLESCIIKCELLQNDVNNHKSKIEELIKEKDNYLNEICEWKSRYDDLEKQNSILLKCVDKLKFTENCLDLKNKEVFDLNKQINSIQDEHKKRVSRIKDRTEMQKRAFQSQINGLEQELVQLRATLNIFYKDRDDMKKRMQTEITNLEQKFLNSQLEMKNLKSHINILNSSYTNMLKEFEDNDSDRDTLKEGDDDNEDGDYIEDNNNNILSNNDTDIDTPSTDSYRKAFNINLNSS